MDKQIVKNIKECMDALQECMLENTTECQPWISENYADMLEALRIEFEKD